MVDSSLPFENSGPAAGRDVTGEFAGAASAPWTVSALVARIKEALLDAFPRRVSVVGQVSNFKRAASGHLYFSLKDESAAIDAVMFRADAASVRFDLADGLEVLAEGRVDVYERQGRLQLYVQRLSPKGTGALELAFRQLKERLEREGLFDPARKSLGMMIAYAVKYYYMDIWWNWLMPPIVCLSLLIMTVTFLAISLEKVLDPRLKEALGA